MRLGAVIRFEPDVVRADAEAIIQALVKKGIIRDTNVESYDSNYGGPVWYIP